MRWGSLRRSRRAGFSHFKKKKKEPTLRPATWEDEGDPLHLNESRCCLQTRSSGFQARRAKGSGLHVRTVDFCSFSELLIIGGCLAALWEGNYQPRSSLNKTRTPANLFLFLLLRIYHLATNLETQGPSLKCENLLDCVMENFNTRICSIYISANCL